MDPIYFGPFSEVQFAPLGNVFFSKLRGVLRGFGAVQNAAASANSRQVCTYLPANAAAVCTSMDLLIRLSQSKNIQREQLGGVRISFHCNGMRVILVDYRRQIIEPLLKKNGVPAASVVVHDRNRPIERIRRDGRQVGNGACSLRNKSVEVRADQIILAKHVQYGRSG